MRNGFVTLIALLTPLLQFTLVDFGANSACWTTGALSLRIGTVFVVITLMHQYTESRFLSDHPISEWLGNSVIRFRRLTCDRADTSASDEMEGRL